MDLCIHLLHGEVRALDDADFDARASRIDARTRPILEALESAEGIRQVCLEDNAGLVAAHIRLIKDGGKHRDRQIEVLVVLHVEVQECPIIAGEAIERQERADAVVDDLLETPGIMRAGHRRDLNGHVIDVLARHEPRDLAQAMGRFLLAKNRLAEEVHVQAVTALAQTPQRRAQPLVRRVDDEVSDDLTEHTARRGGHRVRSEARGSRP